MQFEIDTYKLQNILNNAKKGTGDGKINEITKYFWVNVNEDGMLTVISTDLNCYLTVFEKLEGKVKAGEAVIEAENIVKLINNTSVKKVKFNDKNSYIEVTGNGKYKIQKSGLEFPVYEYDLNDGSFAGFDVNTEALQKAINSGKVAVSDDMALPYLTGFYCSDKGVIATDGVKLYFNNNGFFNVTMLLSSKMALLLDIFPENIKVFYNNEKGLIVFTSENIILLGAELAGIEDYPDVNKVKGLSYNSFVVLPKDELLEVLGRTEIFADPLDNFCCYLQFEKTGLRLLEYADNSDEIIVYAYKDNNNFVEGIKQLYNIKHLKELVSAINDKVVKIYFGDRLPLKITDEFGNIETFLSRMK